MASSGDETERSLRRIIRHMQSSVTGIEAVAVISGDGLPRATALPQNTDEDRFGAMCASLLALAEQASDEIRRGNLRQVLVEGEAGSMLLVKAGPDQVLAVSAAPTANIGRMFMEARKTAAQVANLCDRKP